MKRVMVTGGNGQLGRCLRDASAGFPDLQIHFSSREELDITDATTLREYFRNNDIEYCINAAAYTNVEKAESEPEKAFESNAEAVKTLAEICAQYEVTLLHISTDYVFDGTNESPYRETDPVNPINTYGNSKLKGEQYLEAAMKSYYILRTSWLYSNYGKNFYTSMLRFAEEGKALQITTAETGTPTNAHDLAHACFEIITSPEPVGYGVYHYSNAGEATWYDFAHAIFNIKGLLETVNLQPTDYFKTEAKRPAYSVLDTQKIIQALSVNIKEWEESLKSLTS